jgi:hypothetical protein
MRLLRILNASAGTLWKLTHLSFVILHMSSLLPLQEEYSRGGYGSL